MDPATGLAVNLGITFGLKALQWLLAEPEEDKKPKRFTNQPSMTEGDALPLVYGQTRIFAPFVTWHSVSVSSRSPTDFDAVGPLTPADEREHGVSMLFNLGMPAGVVGPAGNARLLGFYIGDEKLDLDLGSGEHRFIQTAASGAAGPDPTVIPFSTRIGYPRGLLQFFAGTSTQTISNNDPPTSAPLPDDVTEIAKAMRVDRQRFGNLAPDPTLIPSYRGQMLVGLSGYEVENGTLGYFFRNVNAFFLGTSEDLPAISFEVWSHWNQFIPGPQQSGDANPADVIFDIITNSFGRLGMPTSLIDTTSFTSAANQLASEGHGFSHVFDSQTTGLDALKTVVNQIGGALYYDQVTNKIHLKLIRDDYDDTTIPHFTADHVVDDPDYRWGWGKNTIDLVEIKYRDRARAYQDATFVRQNQASAVAQGDGATDGRLRSITIDYPGCSNRELAAKLAERDLSYLSQPLSAISLKLNRLVDVTGNYNASQLRPGDVFKLTLPEYSINGVVFRVERADPGQLGANVVTVEAAQDPFWIAGSTSELPDVVVGYLPVPTPINHRKIMESPRWFERRASEVGFIDSIDKQRLFGLAAPDDGSTAYTVRSGLGLGPTFDVRETAFAQRFILGTAIDREDEPYDTTTTLEIDFGSAKVAVVATIEDLVATLTLPDDLAAGYTMFMIDDEIMAFETFVDTGNGVAEIGEIWRGLLDTSPTAHAALTEGWLIGILFDGRARVGRKAWPHFGGVRAITQGRLGIAIGNGGEPIDTLDIEERTLMQLRATDFNIAGDKLTNGTAGMPAYVFVGLYSGYKRATLDEDIRLMSWIGRDLNRDEVERGDSVFKTLDSDVRYKLLAQKVGEDEVELDGSIDWPGGELTTTALVGKAGHGEIDLILRTGVFVPAVGNDPAHVADSCWDPQRIRVTAPQWRNLLAQPRFDISPAGVLDADDYGIDGWTVGASTPTVAVGSTSLTRHATLSKWIQGGAAGGSCSFTQTIDISGYKPRAMRAALWLYFRNYNIDADDTIAFDLVALDAAGSTLATTSFAATAGSITLWRKVGVANSALPADTVKLRVTVTLAPVGGGDTTAHVMATELACYVGDFLDDVLTNPAFDSSGTGWTNVTNSFAYPTTLPFASRSGAAGNYAQGGAFSSSEISQDYTVPVGREFGTAVLRCWRMNEGNNDTGAVILEARNGGGLLSSVTTGIEAMASQGIWYPRQLELALPDGTTTVRVRLQANRAGGAGNSGASFDDMHLQMVSDLDPQFERELDLRSPSYQPMPSTWTEWHTTYVEQIDNGVKAPLVIGPHTRASGSSFTSPTLRLRWQDDVARADDMFVGQWGGPGRGAIPGTRFTRQSGAGALDVQSFAELNGSRAACPRSSESFSVVVFFRVDEASFSTACGIVGRCDNTSGWELAINSSGELQAILRGTAGTKTVTRTGSTVIDGAIHMAALVYDAAAQTLKIYDERGSDSVSTATGLGEIANRTMSTVLRVGRSRSTIDTIPGFLGPVYFFNTALPGNFIRNSDAAIWQYGLDPTGYLTTHNRAEPILVGGGRYNDNDTIACLGEDQVAFGLADELEQFGDDIGSQMGFPESMASDNLISTWDFTNGNWVAEAGVTLTQAVVDPTGKPLGANVAGATTTNGIYARGITVTASPDISVVFWVRLPSGSATLDVDLMNSSNVIKQTRQVTAYNVWRKCVVTFDAWDGSTATCRIRFGANSGTVTFDLAHVVWVGQTSEVPTVFPTAALSSVTVDHYATFDDTYPLQLNAEGELLIEGVASKSDPGVPSVLANVSNGSNQKNERELSYDAFQSPVFDHQDATPANSGAAATAIDWSTPWQLRGRWSVTKMLDATANSYASLIVDGSVDSIDLARSSTFSYDATANMTLMLGKGSIGGAANAYIRRVILRAREEKLT